MSYETALERQKKEFALAMLESGVKFVRRYTRSSAGKPVLSLVVPFEVGELTGELVERIRVNNQEGT